jgi:hypothetical protein
MHGLYSGFCVGDAKAKGSDPKDRALSPILLVIVSLFLRERDVAVVNKHFRTSPRL